MFTVYDVVKDSVDRLTNSSNDYII
jgi:hypothetical protein